jgi:16S rRNA (guanine(966)-N(2))-methyltransferase RsmD
MRVVAGRCGGTKLVAPAGAATRPTSDRVREALFSILGDVEGARVLDLYAGTGALGIEAISRGAASTVFVESRPAAIAAISKNLSATRALDQARVVARRAERAVGEIVELGPFDLILADPPYASVDDATALIARLLEAGAVAPSGRVVLEHGSRTEPPALGLPLVTTRKYGDTAVSIWGGG